MKWNVNPLMGTEENPAAAATTTMPFRQSTHSHTRVAVYIGAVSQASFTCSIVCYYNMAEGPLLGQSPCACVLSFISNSASGERARPLFPMCSHVLTRRRGASLEPQKPLASERERESELLRTALSMIITESLCQNYSSRWRFSLAQFCSH